MDLTGRSLKQYELLGRLGAGGMGVVYRARDTVLGREAAVKVLSPDKLQDEEARSRFLREARAASTLNHPNVVTVYEIGSADGIDFIAMELVAGHTLHAVLRQRRLTPVEAGGYALQAATALTKAHAAGVVHRDIKPSNMVITEDGLVKLLDFGLARLNEAAKPDAETQAQFATRAGSVLGTVAYMSPEQAKGDDVGAPSDIFSLGVVLFEMLSGQLPFSGDSEFARLHSLHFSPPKDLQALAPDVDEDLTRVVARMLEKNLAVRHGSMADVLRDLRRVAGLANTDATPPALPSNPSPTVTIVRAPRRIEFVRRMQIGLAATLILGAAIAAGWMAQSRATSEAAALPTADSALLDAASPHELYLRARALLDRFDREGNAAQAIPLLERAVEKDPTFALGHATLTEAYHLRNQVAPDEQWRNMMMQSAERAVALKGDMATAHIALGLALITGQAGRGRGFLPSRHRARSAQCPAPLSTGRGAAAGRSRRRAAEGSGD
ncbi:MAG: protein kinase [Casimicrobiaceae bacterium]